MEIRVFLRTKFSTVAVDTFDLRGTKNRLTRLKEEVFKQSNWPALVFASGPQAAATLARRLAEVAPPPSASAIELADWTASNYGAAWSLVDALRAGIGLHHSKIPRSLAAMFVRLFNAPDNLLPVLLCTSTLIEGVNTAAKSVLIYDKVINKADYDFFTFSNIRGRAGRLGQHLVGKVFLFNEPPEQTNIEVNSPVLNDLDEAPDELVVHLEDEERSASTRERVTEISARLGLPISALRRLSSLGLDNLARTKELVEHALETSPDRLVWRGYPDYHNLLALADIVVGGKGASEFGAGSSAQLVRFIRKLREPRSFKAFFEEYAESNKGYESQFDGIFRFLRACEFSLPEYFTAIEQFAKAILKVDRVIDYSLLIGEIARWFRPDVLKALEEQGVPIQISERFYGDNDTLQSLSARLLLAAQSDDPRLSDLERDWIVGSLPVPATDRVSIRPTGE